MTITSCCVEEPAADYIARVTECTCGDVRIVDIITGDIIYSFGPTGIEEADRMAEHENVHQEVYPDEEGDDVPVVRPIFNPLTREDLLEAHRVQLTTVRKTVRSHLRLVP